MLHRGIILSVLTWIEHVGAMGASASMLLTALFTTLTTGAMLVRRFGSLIQFGTLLKALAATAVTALIAPHLMLTGPRLELKYVLLIGVYGLVILLLRELDENDVAALALWRKKQA